MKQTVYNKKLSNTQGFFVVLALVVLLVAANYLVIDVLAKFLGYTAASIGFWVMGIALGLWVFRTYIEAFEYELSDDVLRICRAYGKRTRLVEDIYLSCLIFVGDAAEAEKRNPKLTRIHAFHKGCKLPLTAVVYENSSGKRMALVQLNDEMLAALKAKMKAK